MRFVLDCSVTMNWCFEDEINGYSENILDALQKNYEARVPPIWRLEVINVLILTERKKRISKLIANNFKNALNNLKISIDHFATEGIFYTVYELPHELKLTAYEAAYLELALREKLPIATLDQALIRAAAEIKVDLFSC